MTSTRSALLTLFSAALFAACVQRSAPITIARWADDPARTAAGTLDPAFAATPWTLTPERFRADLEPIPVPSCGRRVDVVGIAPVTIKSNLYGAGMISADSVTFLALCAVPGRIRSGEMHQVAGRTLYEVRIIPERGTTHATVLVDANTGEVLSSRTYGGRRALAAYLRDTVEHRDTFAKPPTLP